MRSPSSAAPLASLALLCACHGVASNGSAAGADGGADEAGADVRIDATRGDAGLDADVGETASSEACSGDVGVRSFDAACPIIRASDYDQSCATDSDCVEVGEGNTCVEGCGLSCGGRAINRCALERYLLDLAVAGFNPDPRCNCPADFGACCRAGRCVDDFCCMNPCPDAGSGD